MISVQPQCEDSFYQFLKVNHQLIASSAFCKLQ